MTANDIHAPEQHVAEFRFYRELNDFLPAERRQVGFPVTFTGSPAVRDTIQAVGVPHTAVDLILVGGESVGFGHRLRGGERVAVYPEFERLDISPVQRLRPRPLRRTRFISDVHLGRLTRYLRMLGFDTAYDPAWTDPEIIDRSLAARRIILTRDVGILKQGRVTHGYWIRHHVSRRQLREVVVALDLSGQIRPFTRCMECNGVITDLDRECVRGQVDDAIWRRFETFRRCRECEKIYWKGSHYQRMKALIDGLRAGGDA